MSLNYSTTPGAYTYTQGPNGKGAEGVVKLGATSERNPSAQKNAGGEFRQEGDHGGHLIAHSMAGENSERNLDAQAANVNQIDQRHVEQNVSTLASDPENTVAIQVLNYNRENVDRPDAIMINTGYIDKDGNLQEAHYSFQNASHELQDSWEQSATLYGSEIDPAQNIGMTQEERELADELADSYPFADDRLGEGWTYIEYGQTAAETQGDNSLSADAESGTEESPAEDSGTSEDTGAGISNDSGIDMDDDDGLDM